MKILLFGGLATGKTTLARKLIHRYPEFEYIAVDNLRQKLGDNSQEKELLAKSAFINAIIPQKKQIIEASGIGNTGKLIYKKLKNSFEKKLIIILCVSAKEQKKRLQKRRWNIPYPSDKKDFPINSLKIRSKDIQKIWKDSSNTFFIELNNNTLKEQRIIEETISFYIKLFNNETKRTY